MVGGVRKKQVWTGNDAYPGIKIVLPYFEVSFDSLKWFAELESVFG